MDKLQMQSKNLVDENIEFIAKRFPNCVTEALNEEGKLTKLVDFDMLKQELSKDIVKGNDERYTLNWAGKKQAILTANSPINATLRPCREESVNFDNTKNLYIEGDNLDVLKLLRETYLNKVKMIYIDPPYNTGHDFVYEDDFATSTEDYLQSSKSYDDQGNRMFQNNDSNGRFHSDWLSMMYSRLKLAKDLLDKDDGAIFISIDDNELANLQEIADSIFGNDKFVTCIPRITKNQRSGQEDYMDISHDYILVYSYASNFEHIIDRQYNDGEICEDHIGKYIKGDTKAILAAKSQGYSKGGDYDFVYKGKTYAPVDKDGKRNRWLWTKERMEAAARLGILVETKNSLRVQLYLNKKFDDVTNEMIDKNEKLIFHTSDFMDNNSYTNSVGYNDLYKLFKKQTPTNMYPKPVELIKKILSFNFDKSSTVLDFFSGSATTAHAVMQLNAEDGGNRKFIMVQLPEKCDEKSEAYKAGYKNICEIGKERIRRAGKKIKEDRNIKIDVDKNKLMQRTLLEDGSFDDKYALKVEKPNEDNLDKLDIGFRVLKLDSSCMKDIYYSPNKTTQDLLTQFEDNIKEDRTPEDLLFQVMLDMGVLLSSEIKTLEINGKKVFNVNDGDLVCCFDKNIDDDTVTQIAKMKPLYALFRDSSMSSDSVAVNFDQIFETYSQSTTRKII